MFKKLPLTLLSLSYTILASPTCLLPIPSTSYTSEVPSWLSLNYSCTGSPQVWEARPSPGKGIGVFATRTLEPGDIILTETPVMRIQPPKFRDGAAYPLNNIGPLLQPVFEGLDEEQKAAVLALHAYMTPEEAAPGNSRLLPIFRSNAYIIGTSMSELGLFPKGARINHSCRPNSSQVWLEKQGKRIVRAIRRIEEGEEIFATYIPLLRGREIRQKRLQQYGFTCTCSACALEKAEQEASDKRRDDIRNAFNDLEPQLTLDVAKGVAARKRAERNAEASLQLAQLVEKEGLADYYAQAYRVVAISWARIEKWSEATLWAHKSLKLREMADGDAPGTLEMRALTARFIGSWNEELYNNSKKQA
ncbi:SET domain-containing protein [Byssothecium circinans]|uniref:SET domain-containing protein n=1 Tax=Byssothecium circinans TaxID=147558 RepID=A0A6A5TZN2_9PLEO|nr:SET domain-containing protein [Byssothecium circinans]